MDKNQVTGLVLISVILIAYLQFFAPEPVEQLPEESNTEKNISDSLHQKDEAKLAASDYVVNDSVADVEKRVIYGPFASFVTDDEKIVEVENNTSKYTFSSKGGVIKKVELKNYKTYSKEPLILFDENTRKEQLKVKTEDGKSIDLNTLSFTTSNTSTKVTQQGDSTIISYKVQLSASQFIQKEYVISADKYEVGYKLYFKGLDDLLDKPVQVTINDKGKHFEKDITQSRYRSTINYMLEDDDFDYLTERSMDEQEEEIENVKWFSFKQKFFSKAIIAKNGISKAKIKTKVDESSDEFTKLYIADYSLDYNTLTQNDQNFILYFGPNKYSILEDVGYDMEENVYLGIPLIRQINQFIILPLFNLLSSLFSNFGLVIFLLVLIIKTAIFPFTFKSYKGFAKMRVLKPELDELKEKCGDDNTKYQQEQMKVYQKFGVSPLSGCIPMLFQMPFLFALFQLFPNSIELRGKSFLWAEDLSSYDAFFTWTTDLPFLGTHISLFTLLMTASTVAYTYVNQQVTPTATAPGQPNMKVMSYMMPVIFFFVLNDYASGLTYYYFLSNLITMSQQLLSKKFIDEDKILAKMKEYSVKSAGKKKSSFSKRLEEAMKAQQEKQRKK